jgi:hypothetical protein
MAFEANCDLSTMLEAMCVASTSGQHGRRADCGLRAEMVGQERMGGN